MDNKFHHMMDEFIKNSGAKNADELNEKMQEFIEKYNNGEIEYENTPLDDAYEVLGKAQQAKTEKQAEKLAKKAYDISNECFDAILFQVSLQDNLHQSIEMLDQGLLVEKERLEKEGFFDQDNIGSFYGLFETRPYIRGLYTKAQILFAMGKVTPSKVVCKEILRLNENDNTGARYLLMSIYAVLEDEKEILKLYKKFPEDNLEMLFPLLALYYKLDEKDKAKEYLKKVEKANKQFLKIFVDGISDGEFLKMDAYYQRGEKSEVAMYVQNYIYLITSVPSIVEFVEENLS